MKMKKTVVFLSVIASVLLAAAEFDIKVTSTSKTGVVKAGEKVTVSAVALCDGKSVPAGYTLRVQRWDDGKGVKNESLPAEKEYKTVLERNAPGWSYVTFNLLDKSKKEIKSKNRVIRVGTGIVLGLDKIAPARKEPADFDAFWNAAKAELAGVPLKVLEMKKVSANRTHEFFDVKVACAGPKPVSGYLSKPLDRSRKYPVILMLHGAGVATSYKSNYPGAIAFNVNAHGILNGQPAKYYADLKNGALKGYPLFNNGNRDKIYFRYMFLRVLRALEFLRTVPEWNGKDIIVSGSSQGGAQTVFAAGMDPSVTFAIVTVPAMADISGCLAPYKRNSGWPKPYRNTPKDSGRVSAWDYYDGVNFARRIKCRIYVSTGLIDTTCPPTAVHCLFNQIPSKEKSIEIHRDMGHVARNDNGWKAFRELCEKAAK